MFVASLGAARDGEVEARACVPPPSCRAPATYTSDMRVLHRRGRTPELQRWLRVMSAMARRPDEFEQVLVHTGQHYDRQMSRVFFDELGLPQPDVDLNVGSASHADQTARAMTAFEPVVSDWRPDWVVVVGDVNSTLASALVCAKLHVRVAHLEAGLRSYDRSMPEEINRVVTDQVADLLLTPSADADANLLREGVAAERIALVGNVMIDTLVPAAARGALPGGRGAARARARALRARHHAPAGQRRRSRRPARHRDRSARPGCRGAGGLSGASSHAPRHRRTAGRERAARPATTRAARLPRFSLAHGRRAARGERQAGSRKRRPG